MTTDTKNKSRTLPKKHKRPQKSLELKRFEEGIQAINTFYWSALSGYYMLSQHRPPDAISTQDFLPNNISDRFNINIVELDTFLAEQNIRLRFLCLVDAVTRYEEYISSFIEKTLLEIALPGEPVSGWAKETYKKWANDTTKHVIKSAYEDRHKEIDKILGLTITSGKKDEKSGSEHRLDTAKLKAAGLFRNCIIHNGGIVDARTTNKLGGSVKGIKTGELLPIDEDLFFDLIGALLKHAKDIDLLVRCRWFPPSSK